MTWLRDVPIGQLGVDETDGTPPYDDRRGDAEIEWRLGGTGPLVVVAGPRRAGASRAVARAARALLADHVVVGHDAAVAPDLPDLVARAGQAMRRTTAPGALVWLDGAGLATLDAITPALVAGLPEGVRLVVTVEELLLCSWFPDPATVGLLTAPGTLVRLAPGPASSPAAVRTVLTPIGWGSLLPVALARAATDWRRAGVPLALDRKRLLGLARVHRHLLGLADSDAEDDALAAALERVVAEDTHGVRLLRRHGTGPAAHHSGVKGADVVADGASSASWELPSALIDCVASLDDTDDRVRDVVGRTLLLRGAWDLVVRLVEDGWGHPNPTQAGELAAAATRLGLPALVWHREALGSSRHAHVVAARRALDAAAVVSSQAPSVAAPLRVRPHPVAMRVVTRAPTRPDPAAIPHPREPLSAPSPEALARVAEERAREDRAREDEARAREAEEREAQARAAEERAAEARASHEREDQARKAREHEAREREDQAREAREREAREREAREREARERETREREAQARAAEAQAQADAEARDFEAQARAERRWTRERPVFDQAEAAVRWAIVGNDVHGAWESLAVLESTDPPREFAERAASRRRQVEDLARRCARGAAPGTSVEPPGYATQVEGLRRAREDAARGGHEAEVSGHVPG